MNITKGLPFLLRVIDIYILDKYAGVVYFKNKNCIITINLSQKALNESKHKPN